MAKAELMTSLECDVPVLMSAENPQGWKLEDLCNQLTHEMHQKSLKISPEQLANEDWRIVHQNNLVIMQHLANIHDIQLHSMEITDRLRKEAQQSE